MSCHDSQQCLTCGEDFVPKTARQVYCCRRCFKKAYTAKNKASEYPIFACPSCRVKTPLDFHPKRNLNRWLEFCCSNCGYCVTNHVDISIEIKITEVSSVATETTSAKE